MSFWMRNWWVALFCSLALFAHFHFSAVKKGEMCQLTSRLDEMLEEKRDAEMAKEDLELRIASQNDPAWIEMVLIRELGVVPEGFLKVHFK